MSAQPLVLPGSCDFTCSSSRSDLMSSDVLARLPQMRQILVPSNLASVTCHVPPRSSRASCPKKKRDGPGSLFFILNRLRVFWDSLVQGYEEARYADAETSGEDRMPHVQHAAACPLVPAPSDETQYVQSMA